MGMVTWSHTQNIRHLTGETDSNLLITNAHRMEKRTHTPCMAARGCTRGVNN